MILLIQRTDEDISLIQDPDVIRQILKHLGL